MKFSIVVETSAGTSCTYEFNEPDTTPELIREAILGDFSKGVFEFPVAQNQIDWIPVSVIQRLTLKILQVERTENLHEEN